MDETTERSAQRPSHSGNHLTGRLLEPALDLGKILRRNPRPPSGFRKRLALLLPQRAQALPQRLAPQKFTNSPTSTRSRRPPIDRNQRPPFERRRRRQLPGNPRLRTVRLMVPPPGNRAQSRRLGPRNLNARMLAHNWSVRPHPIAAPAHLLWANTAMGRPAHPVIVRVETFPHQIGAKDSDAYTEYWPLLTWTQVPGARSRAVVGIPPAGGHPYRTPPTGVISGHFKIT